MNAMTYQIQAARQARLDPNNSFLDFKSQPVQFQTRFMPVQLNLFTLLDQVFQPSA
jgi:hypothetical protein